MLTNVALMRVGSVLITCLGKTEPTDAEIGKMIERFELNDYQALLFSARGGGPNSKQRARIADSWKASGRKPPRTVLLTDSMAARFVAQVFSILLGTETRCLAPDELESGLAYLGRPAELGDVAGCLAALHAALEFKQRQAGYSSGTSL
jgi:hypothetical protein